MEKSKRSRKKKVMSLIREELFRYGIEDNQSVLVSIRRLIREHKDALDLRAQTLLEMERLEARCKVIQGESDLAKAGRTAAQGAANRSLKLARKFEADSKRYRTALDLLLSTMPTSKSEVDDWIENDKKKWEEGN